MSKATDGLFKTVYSTIDYAQRRTLAKILRECADLTEHVDYSEVPATRFALAYRELAAILIERANLLDKAQSTD